MPTLVTILLIIFLTFFLIIAAVAVVILSTVVKTLFPSWQDERPLVWPLRPHRQTPSDRQRTLDVQAVAALSQSDEG